MTEQRRIVVSIDPMGVPTIEAQNFHGMGCTDATKGIESALAPGQGGATRVLKPEWYEANDATNQQQEQQRW